jgi:hypothetical protein
VKATAPALSLTYSERARVLEELEGALMSLEVVVEHLAVAAARQGTTVAARTERQLDTAREGLSDVRGRVARAPVQGD